MSSDLKGNKMRIGFAVGLMLGASSAFAAGKPDLTMSPIEISATHARLGDAIVVTTEIKNIGNSVLAAPGKNAPATTVEIGLLPLGSDGIRPEATTWRAIGSWSPTADLVPGAKVRRKLQIAIPASAKTGKQLICAVVDRLGRVEERRTDNNRSCAGITLELRAVFHLADAAIASVRAGPIIEGAHQFDVTVKNASAVGIVGFRIAAAELGAHVEPVPLTRCAEGGRKASASCAEESNAPELAPGASQTLGLYAWLAQKVRPHARAHLVFYVDRCPLGLEGPAATACERNERSERAHTVRLWVTTP